MKSIILNLLILILSILPLVVFSQSFIPGVTYFDSTGFVEYRAGNIPIIISASHGGILEPDSIPDLACNGTPSELIDAYTKQIAEGLFNTLHEETGCYPHVIINLLHKKKFQANRNLANAACGNPIVEKAWYGYHSFIDSAKAKIVQDYGSGLFLDLHGHGHDIQRIELGYLLSAEELQLSDNELDMDIYVEESSVRALANSNVQNITHSDLLRGEHSFGSLMDNKGFPSVPSSSDSFPLTGEPYFTGGYNTQRHGSRDDNDEIDAIQIEFNQDIRFDSAIRETLIDSLAATSIEYINYHYNDQFIDNFCGLVLGVSDRDIGNYNFKLFPNPATEYFYFESDVSDIELVIYNQLGQKIISKKRNTNKINIAFLPSGFYMIQIKKEDIFLGLMKLVKK